MKSKVFSLVVSLIFVGTVAAGPLGRLRAAWGVRGCSTQVDSSAATVVAQDGWTDYQGCQYLYVNGKQIGGYDPSTNTYRSYDSVSDQWSAPQPLPCHCCKDCTCNPCRCKDKGTACCGGCKCKSKAAGFLFGVDTSKLCKDGKCHHYLNGRPVSKQAALNALTLSDDSKKPFLTFIGDGAKEAFNSFSGTPEAQKCRMNWFPKDAWEVKDIGFKTDGKPSIYLQKSTGEVLCRFDSDPGTEKLAGEVRKADPSYDPNKDPNGNVANPLNFVKNIPASVWVLGALVLLFLFKRKG